MGSFYMWFFNLFFNLTAYNVYLSPSVPPFYQLHSIH